MDKPTIKLMVHNGITKANHSQIVNAYKFITGKALGGSCGECAKRRAIQAIIQYAKVN